MNSEVRFKSFVDRLKYVIGEEDYTPWAEGRGLSPVTVLGWFNGANLYPKSWDKLVSATGIPKDWWLNGQTEPPVLYENLKANMSSGFPYGMMDKPINKVVKQNLEQAAKAYQQPDGDVLIDYYVDIKGSAGPGEFIDTGDEEVVIKVKIDARLLRERVGGDFKRLKMAGVNGDSMLPTLSHGDQVLLDVYVNEFVDDAIYAFLQDGYLRYKRIQKRLDGTIVVKSDNPSFGEPETYTKDEASNFHIVGMVTPFKFGRFKI